MITMSFDEQQLDDLLRRYSSESIDKAESRALTKSKGKVLTAITRAITAEYNIKARDVKKHMKVVKSGKSILVKIDSQNFKLIDFSTVRNVRQRTAPTVKIKKNGSKVKLSSMFYAVMNSGHMGIFMRARASKRFGLGSGTYKRIKEKYNKRGEELAITEMSALDSVDMAEKVNVEDKVLEVFRDTFQSEVVRQLSSGLV